MAARFGYFDEWFDEVAFSNTNLKRERRRGKFSRQLTSGSRMGKLREEEKPVLTSYRRKAGRCRRPGEDRRMDENERMEKDVISLLDEDGKEHEFEIVDRKSVV